MTIKQCDKCGFTNRLKKIDNKKLCSTCYSEYVLQQYLYKGLVENNYTILQHMINFDANKNCFRLSNKISNVCSLHTIYMDIINETSGFDVEYQEKISNIYHALFKQLIEDFKNIINVEG